MLCFERAIIIEEGGETETRQRQKQKRERGLEKKTEGWMKKKSRIGRARGITSVSLPA